MSPLPERSATTSNTKTKLLRRRVKGGQKGSRRHSASAPWFGRFFPPDKMAKLDTKRHHAPQHTPTATTQARPRGNAATQLRTQLADATTGWQVRFPQLPGGSDGERQEVEEQAEATADATSPNTTDVCACADASTPNRPLHPQATHGFWKFTAATRLTAGACLGSRASGRARRAG